MKLVIIDSGGANLGSVRHALKRLGVDAQVSKDVDTIALADRLILPGVGAAGDAMQRLRQAGLDRLIPQLKQPLLGICLGLQLMYESSAEDKTRCLGIFPGEVERFQATPQCRVPHMGWNALQFTKAADPRLSDAICAAEAASQSDSWAYFVHSFYAPVSEFTWAQCQHGRAFTALARRDNFLAAQFHPERSAGAGAALLRYFLNDFQNDFSTTKHAGAQSAALRSAGGSH